MKAPLSLGGIAGLLGVVLSVSASLGPRTAHADGSLWPVFQHDEESTTLLWPLFTLHRDPKAPADYRLALLAGLAGVARSGDQHRVWLLPAFSWRQSPVSSALRLGWRLLGRDLHPHRHSYFAAYLLDWTSGPDWRQARLWPLFEWKARDAVGRRERSIRVLGVKIWRADGQATSPVNGATAEARRPHAPAAAKRGALHPDRLGGSPSRGGSDRQP